jgi:ferrous iron transport protein B
MGNPNVGKSVVFSRLTGIRVISSNYPGTTVEFTQGEMAFEADKALLIDAPGVYGLETSCKAEEIAVKMIEDADAIINVVDATNLERNLHLTLHLLEKHVPMVVAFNMWDEAKHQGIHINLEKIEGILGVPVVPTIAVTGEGIRDLVKRLADAPVPTFAPISEEHRWTEVGRIVNAVQALTHRHHTFWDLLSDASVRPVMGLPIAAVVLVLSFTAIRLIGEGLVRLAFQPLFEGLWKPFLLRLDGYMHPGGFWHHLLIGTLVNGQIDFVQSFGMLTTGLFVAVAMVFPYVLAFYLILGLLEDFGYLPRLAVLLDTLMHRMGLHGWAIIPMLLGFGCNVPGILATRMLESPRERWIAATLVSIAVPCASLQAMMWGVLGHHGARYVAGVFAILLLVWIVLGWMLNALLKGASPELIIDIPPYRLPSPRAIVSKLWIRIRQFFKEAVPFVLLGVLIVNALDYVRVFDRMASAVAPVVTYLFGLPKEAVLALVLGFLRKDVAVGMLASLNLTPKQMVISVTLLAISFPCIATFIVLARELGLPGLLKSISAMILVSLLTGVAMNLIL